MAFIGSGFGVFLIVLGLLIALFGNIIVGIWWFLIGMFLKGAAAVAYSRIEIRHALEGAPVRRLMRADVPSIGPDTPVALFVEHHIGQYPHRLYAVMDGYSLLGVVSLSHLSDALWSEASNGRRVRE